MFTFGSTTATRINYTMPIGLHGNTRSCLNTGWVLPTTLTAGRTLWGGGATDALKIHTTTSQLQQVLVAATTTGLYTSPSILTVGTPTFVAILVSQGGTGVGTVRMWTAGVNTPPVEQTITVTTAAAGAWTTSSTTWSIGNGSGTVPLQGDLGGVTGITSAFNAIGFDPIFGMQTSGVCTQTEADLIKARYVEPIWRGDLGAVVRYTVYVDPNIYGFMYAANLDDTLAYAVRGDRAPTAGAISVATPSVNKTPHPFPNDDLIRLGAGRWRRAVTQV